MIKKQDKQKSNWEVLKKALRLINLDVNTSNPDDPAYVFNAFCPLTVRLIEEVIGKGWGSLKEILTKIPGATEFPSQDREKEMKKVYKNKANLILIVFIGGITYAEISAIRLLNKLNPDYKFFMLTTHITSGRRIIDKLRLNIDTNNMTMKDFHTQLKNIK